MCCRWSRVLGEKGSLPSTGKSSNSSSSSNAVGAVVAVSFSVFEVVGLVSAFAELEAGAADILEDCVGWKELAE